MNGREDFGTVLECHRAFGEGVEDGENVDKPSNISFLLTAHLKEVLQSDETGSEIRLIFGNDEAKSSPKQENAHHGETLVVSDILRN
jgi:hypothetical protein